MPDRSAFAGLEDECRRQSQSPSDPSMGTSPEHRALRDINEWRRDSLPEPGTLRHRGVRSGVRLKSRPIPRRRCAGVSADAPKQAQGRRAKPNRARPACLPRLGASTLLMGCEAQSRGLELRRCPPIPSAFCLELAKRRFGEGSKSLMARSHFRYPLVFL